MVLRTNERNPLHVSVPKSPVICRSPHLRRCELSHLMSSGILSHFRVIFTEWVLYCPLERVGIVVGPAWHGVILTRTERTQAVRLPPVSLLTSRSEVVCRRAHPTGSPPHARAARSPRRSRSSPCRRCSADRDDLVWTVGREGQGEVARQNSHLLNTHHYQCIR